MAEPMTAPLPADLPVPAASPLPAALASFGRGPLLPGDDTAAYDALHAELCATLRPRDVFEHALVREAGDLLWEKLSLRRRKAALLTACADQGMRELLKGLNRNDFYSLSKRWAARELEAVGQVDAILNAAGLGVDHVLARTLREVIDEFERIERMIASLEARRTAAVREIADYRRDLAADLSRAVREVETAQDAAFAVLAPPPAQAAPQPAEPAVECAA